MGKNEFRMLYPPYHLKSKLRGASYGILERAVNSRVGNYYEIKLLSALKDTYISLADATIIFIISSS